MSNKTNQIVSAILSAVSETTCYPVSELIDRSDIDPVAIEVDEFLQEHPEEVGLDEYTPCELNFSLDLDNILPYSDQDNSLAFFIDDKLYACTNLPFKPKDEEACEKAIDRYMKESPLAASVGLDFDGECLLTHAICDADDPTEVEHTVSKWLSTMIDNKDFAKIISELLNI